jgi:hypothetical protein
MSAWKDTNHSLLADDQGQSYASRCLSALIRPAAYISLLVAGSGERVCFLTRSWLWDKVNPPLQVLFYLPAGEMISQLR